MTRCEASLSGALGCLPVCAKNPGCSKDSSGQSEPSCMRSKAAAGSVDKVIRFLPNKLLAEAISSEVSFVWHSNSTKV